MRRPIPPLSRLDNWSRGWLTWARVLDPRIRFEVWPDASRTDPARPVGFWGANQGVSGDTCSEILARVPDVVALKPSLCIVDAGTNDVDTGLTAETIHARRVQICEQLVAAGITVVLLSILSLDTSTGATDTTRRKIFHVNELGREYATATKGVYWFDWNAYWVDPANGEGNPFPYMTNDGTHFSTRGAYIVAKELVKLLQSLFPPHAPRVISRYDRFTSQNPRGNIFRNSNMVGDREVNNQTTDPGIVPNPDDPAQASRVTEYMVIRRVAGSGTAYASRSTRVQRGQWMRLEILPQATPSETEFEFRASPEKVPTFVSGSGYDTKLTDGVAAGEWVLAGIDVNVPRYANWRIIQLELKFVEQTPDPTPPLPPVDDITLFTSVGLKNFPIGAVVDYPDESWSGSIVTEPFQLVLPSSGNPTYLQLRLCARLVTSTNQTVRIETNGWWLRRVQNPAPSWS